MVRFVNQLMLLVIILLSQPIVAYQIAKAHTANDCLYQELATFYRDAGTQSCDLNEEQGKKITLLVAQLSHQEKISRLLEIYGQVSTQPVMSKSLHYLIKDLDILCGQGEDRTQHIIGKINHTQTIFGELALAHMLCNPTGDVASLKSRQNLIKELVENPALMQELDQIVKNVKKSESDILSFWCEDNKPTKALINSLFFQGPLGRALNDSAVAMEAKTRINNLANAAIMAVPLMIPATIVYFAKKMEGPRYIHPYGEFPADPAMQGIWKQWLKNYFDPRFYINEPDFAGNRMSLGMGSTAGSLFYAGMHGIQLFVAKKGFDMACQRNDAIKYLQGRLMGIANLVNSAKQIDVLCATHHVINDGLRTSESMRAAFDPQSSKFAECKTLLEQLQTNSFKGEPSFFSLSGRVLAAFAAMEKQKEQFVPLFQALGEVDACLSIAKLYKKFQHQRVVYSFANYQEQSKPLLQLQQFWNPLVDSNVVVPNDLALGAQAPGRNMILTGANTGGKSTILKAIMINILFAQTLTIVPAQSLTITPFTYLGTSLNIADDTAAGTSLYQSEVNRAQELINGAHSLGTNFGFIVIDELFRGTSPDQAELGTQECAKKLAQYDTCLFILATHFTERTTKLEQEMPGIFTNYKVEIKQDEQGNLIRPFKLERGINSTHVAASILDSALKNIN